MLRKTLIVLGLSLLGASALGAKCVAYVWSSPDAQALYAGARWNDTVLGDAEYAFTPAYPVQERALGYCEEHPEALVERGGMRCRSFVLDVELPSGPVEIRDANALLDVFGPIDTEAEAASFARATIGGLARYDGATAIAADGNFLVRMRTMLDNCKPTAGEYAVAYEITPDGQVRVVAEEARRTIEGGRRLCYDY